MFLGRDASTRRFVNHCKRVVCCDSSSASSVCCCLNWRISFTFLHQRARQQVEWRHTEVESLSQEHRKRSESKFTDVTTDCLSKLLFFSGGLFQLMKKLKSHLVRTQSLNVLPLKPGVTQYIAIHATLTARDFFLAYFYPSGPFTCIFVSKTSSDFFLCWQWLTLVSV